MQLKRYVALACLLVQACLVSCGDTDATVRWSGGSVSVGGSSEASTLTLQFDGAEPVAMAFSRRERLGLSMFQSGTGDAAWRTDFAAPGWTATLLSLEQRPGAEQPIAAIVRPAQRTGGTAVVWCAASGTAALEHFYAFLLRFPAESMLTLRDGCDVLGAHASPNGRVSVADVLRRVAQARTQRQVTAKTEGRRWRLVEIVPQLDGDNPLHTAALIKGADGPLAGARVSFAREPHLACTATTGADGVAACLMYDTHGHTVHDASVVAPPTVVTFAGRVSGYDVEVPVVSVAATPAPTRCQSSAVSAEVAAGWSASCRGFASRTWALPTLAIR